MRDLTFRSASTTLRNVENLNVLNGGVLKTKGTLYLWECTLIATHTLELTDYALSSDYTYTIDRRGLDIEIRIEDHGTKINITKK